jgi:hypothetical protein
LESTPGLFIGTKLFLDRILNDLFLNDGWQGLKESRLWRDLPLHSDKAQGLASERHINLLSKLTVEYFLDGGA